MTCIILRPHPDFCCLQYNICEESLGTRIHQLNLVQYITCMWSPARMIFVLSLAIVSGISVSDSSACRREEGREGGEGGRRGREEREGGRGEGKRRGREEREGGEGGEGGREEKEGGREGGKEGGRGTEGECKRRGGCSRNKIKYVLPPSITLYPLMMLKTKQ